MPESFMTTQNGASPETERRQIRSGSANKISAGKFDIDTSRPLHVFEHAYAEAYECSGSEGGHHDHVALVIKDRFPTRKDVIDKCMSNIVNGLMALRNTLVVDWPDDTQRHVLIFKRPEGNALFQHAGQKREPLSEEIARRGVIRPIFQALETMTNLGLFHGNIRPTNVFFINQDGGSQAILGECISSVPGILQPVVYETIERGMTDPEGRGVGIEADDIYSFGATVAVLMRGFNPLENKPNHYIIEEKVNRGSYAVLTDGLRLSPGISEFLRATLNDDPKQRWDIAQLAAWVDGNRATPKPSPMSQKAQRTLDFNGKKYIRPRLLALDLYENTPEAITLIESGNLVKWVERALGDQSMAGQLSASISRAGSSGKSNGYEDRLLCFVSMALDPLAPIRLKNLRVLPSGVGYMLAMAMMRGENYQALGELIRERYAWIWLNHKEHAGIDRNNLIHQFDQASKMIGRRGIDYGIERCLYELCSDVPCLSDMLTNFYVVNCEVLLQAMNKIAKNHKEDRPLDRHIASFVTLRDNRDNSGLMSIIEGSDEMKRSLALITLYQQLQRRFNTPKLVGLTDWLSKDAETVVQRLKNLELKREVMKQLPKEVASGSLTKVLTLIDNPVQVKKDEYDFLKASHQYILYGRERDIIRSELTNNPYYGFNTGRQIAFVVSLVVSVVLIAFTLLMHFSGVKN